MATVTCPSCGLPRAPDLVDSAACPICGTVGSVAEAAAVSPDAGGVSPPLSEATATGGSYPPLAPTPNRPLAGPVVLGFAAGLVVGVGGVLGWQNYPAAGPAVAGSGGSRPPLAEPAAPEGTRPRLAFAVAPMPREVGARAAAPADPGGSRPPLAKTDDPLARPDPPADGFAKADPRRPAALRLDNPDGTASPHVRPGSTLVLRGRVKKLVVSGLDGRAVLDCAELDAAEVVVVGPVGGGSRLAVRAPNGRVAVLARVDGQSKLTVHAPGGAVRFDSPGGSVGGGAAVEVVAKEVGLHGRVDGAGTRVGVRLTAEGTLTFAEVDGPARVEYGPADRGGPEPRVIAGRVGPGAVVRKAD